MGAQGDAVSWWAGFLADELDGCAEVAYTPRPDYDQDDDPAADTRAEVVVTPRRDSALAFTVVAGGNEVPLVTFGDVAELRCFGIPATSSVPGLDPSNQLGVMVAALVSDGATLVRRSLRRRMLVLGPLARHPDLASLPVERAWAPYAELYGTLTMFRRPPPYDDLPTTAFLLPATPGSRARPALRQPGATRRAGPAL
ncbi:hypothetical protein SCB71_19435 [Herbiconiux sp. KACC 21604]|uniref:hypothetical protein n=1 Tax=unclassified Herbiconiux TaxID=2618217 RepID=UPI001491F7AE|nr:hypothetical protein [Herbiconiux sp. SALV-R1]QJU55206.1 hypothetical protein HL652_17370 [Herbiconiux sp. SALV-R1]WPO86371.1 hypothetical protein SCB71_19435 [Herbiconiux sp. KACC 21604]